MSTIFVLVNLLIVSFAIVAPWATIEAFAAGRSAGWLMTFATVISHAYVWYAMAQNTEILFCLGSMWAGYEFILSFIPMGIGENEEKAAEAAANEG